MNKAAIIVLGFLVIGCESGSSENPSGSTTPPAAEATAAPEPPPPPKEPTVGERLADAQNLQEALAVIQPHLGDSQDEIDSGTLLLALWAAGRLQWDDVFVARDETSIKLVKKDSDTARGKRMCYSGSIIQIAKEKIDDGIKPIFVGLMQTNSWDVLHFIAAGSTGNLVERSRARLCGVVTGTYSYSNAGGGTTHAVQMVGMFKLPENMGGTGQ